MKKKKGLRVLLCAAIAVAVLLAAFLIYAGSYYHADEMALAVLDAPGVTQTDGTIVLTPEGACDTGLVFYPGGKVQAEAYLPLLRATGPFDQAVADLRAGRGGRGGGRATGACGHAEGCDHGDGGRGESKEWLLACVSGAHECS